MTAAKRKGTTYESALVSTLGAFFGKRHGLAPRRVAQSGQLDTGDLHGISPFVGQAKAYANLADGLRLGLEGAEVQRVRAGELYGVAFVKRVRQPIGRGYAVMTVATFARILLQLRRAEDLLADADVEVADRHAEETLADLEREFPRA